MKTSLPDISGRIQRIFCARGLTLSTAESCTGGMIAACLTEAPGASTFFVAGVVAYAASSKHEILGLDSGRLKRHGLVSAATAKEMARRIRMIACSDFAISTTGNLGPDVLEEKSRGLVYIAVSSRRRTVVEEHRFRGSRGEIREKAVAAALALTIREVLGR